MRTWRPRPPVVLVIDDDPDILRLLGMLLEGQGCAAIEAASGAAGLQHLDGVDVVVVDQHMPIMTGTQFIQTARETGAQCRFLLISSHVDAAEPETASHADAFLAKPFDVREMMRVVERLFVKSIRPPPPSP